MHPIRHALIDARAVCAGIVLMAFASASSAQTIPEGQSCGGLLCDLGVFGHKTASEAPAPVAAPTAANTVSAAPRPAAATAGKPLAAVSSPVGAKKRAVHKKSVEKASVASAASALASQKTKPVAAAAPAALPSRGAQQQPAAPSMLAAPPPSASFDFQPIYQ